MKKVMMYLLPFVVLIGFAGCATQQFVINSKYIDEKTEGDLQPRIDEQVPFFIHGVLQTDEVYPAKICGGVENIIKVESELTFGQGFLGVITWGIYAPRNVKVFCVSK